MLYLTTESEIRDAIAQYSQADTLWLDTEVADFQTKKPRLSLIQILADVADRQGDRVTVLDVLEYPDVVADFREKIVFNPNIEKVFHNAQYDLKLLGKKQSQNVTCTLEMAKLFPYYLVPINNYQLKTLGEKLCDFPSIEKTEQKGDWGKRPLTSKQLEYAAKDAVYVCQVHQRLLELKHFIEPDPEGEDIEALTLRYRQIEPQWKRLDAEIKHLKKRLQAALEAKKIDNVNGFCVSSYERQTKKVAFKELAKLTQELDLNLDLSVTLTKSLQQELDSVLHQLNVEEEVKIISQLKVTEQDEDNLPF